MMKALNQNFCFSPSSGSNDDDVCAADLDVAAADLVLDGGGGLDGVAGGVLGQPGLDGRHGRKPVPGSHGGG